MKDFFVTNQRDWTNLTAGSTIAAGVIRLSENGVLDGITALATYAIVGIALFYLFSALGLVEDKP
jgi:hypothetical protein